MHVVQATLQSLLERLAVEHPHHSLYQLFALKNGNRGKDGKAAQAGDVVGGMAVTVDHDKVAAAHDLIAVVAANPARLEVAHCCPLNSCVICYAAHMFCTWYQVKKVFRAVILILYGRLSARCLELKQHAKLS